MLFIVISNSFLDINLLLSLGTILEGYSNLNINPKLNLFIEGMFISYMIRFNSFTLSI